MESTTPSPLRNSSSARSSTTESAPPETATATRSPGRSSRCAAMYLWTFSITIQYYCFRHQKRAGPVKVVILSTLYESDCSHTCGRTRDQNGPGRQERRALQAVLRDQRHAHHYSY